METEKLPIVRAQKRIDYKGTLLTIPEGETCRIRVTKRTYRGYTTAASRMRPEGHDFRVESISDTEILVTRNSTNGQVESTDQC